MTKKIAEVKEVMPGVEVSPELYQRLQDKHAAKNEDKILECLEKITYHQGMIESLKKEVNGYSKIA